MSQETVAKQSALKTISASGWVSNTGTPAWLCGYSAKSGSTVGSLRLRNSAGGTILWTSNHAPYSTDAGSISSNQPFDFPGGFSGGIFASITGLETVSFSYVQGY